MVNSEKRRNLKNPRHRVLWLQQQHGHFYFMDTTTQESYAKLLSEHGRAELMIDGNCGCALLGPNLQEGEAEFVEFAPTAAAALNAPLEDKLNACKTALERLRLRLNLPDMGYFFEESHPYGN